MKLRSLIAILLACSLLFMFGCSDDKKEDIAVVLESDNFVFTEDMALYMLAYTRMMLDTEFNSAEVDDSKPLSQQMRTEDESFADYLYRMTVNNIENITLYCEAAYKDDYTVDEGMLYKANETIEYLGSTASDVGMTVEEYITDLFGEGVTLEGLETCTQMMAMCEGYEIYLKDSFDVSDVEISTYSSEHPDDFRKFDALRFTTVNKVFADELAASKSSEEFMSVMSRVSGIDLTDSNKNSIPDILEVNDATVSADIAGEFAGREGAAPGDTTVKDNGDGSYTVTILLSTPKMDDTLTWDFRMIYISSESSTDPYSDAASLRDQWIEKEGGETGFANLAARYSDHPSAYYGGRISGVAKDEMPSDGVSSWLCVDVRKEGDTTMAPGGDDGAYILYFIDGNVPRWKYEVVDTIKSNRAKDKVSGMEKDIRKEFKFDEETMRKIFDKYQEQIIAAHTSNTVLD